MTPDSYGFAIKAISGLGSSRLLTICQSLTGGGLFRACLGGIVEGEFIGQHCSTPRDCNYQAVHGSDAGFLAADPAEKVAAALPDAPSNRDCPH